MSRNIYLTGFMGSGKSTVGAGLAKLLGRRFVDLDQRVAKRLKMSISDAFERLGEAGFRKAEQSELQRTSKQDRLVVATGGGLPVDPANRELMKAGGTVVYLNLDLEICRARLGEEEVAARPLWQDAAAVAELFEQRRDVYADCDLAVDAGVSDPVQVINQIADHVVTQEHFGFDMGGQEAQVFATMHGPDALAPLARGRRVVVLCDRNLARLHLDRYQAVLDDPLVITLAPGERTKSLASAKRVYEAMIQAAIRRSDLFVALGGGVITDLGAMIAATYMRGMDFVLASTSLLGCVDAAVGGKAAVNLGHVKNIVGCFTQPQAVILDLAALCTLKRAHRIEGLVEAYKTGLVASPELRGLVKEQVKPLLAGDLGLLADVARLSAKTKAKVVVQDFRESGIRKILNLGHTYGHAVEGANNFRVSHGKAVAAGLMAAARISLQRGVLAKELADEIVEMMRPLAPGTDKWPGAEEAWEIMLRDKKNRRGGQAFVLLQDVGRAEWVDDLEMSELQQALAGLKE